MKWGLIMLYTIPLTNIANQMLSFKININKTNIHIKLFLRYLEEYITGRLI